MPSNFEPYFSDSINQRTLGFTGIHQTHLLLNPPFSVAIWAVYLYYWTLLALNRPFLGFATSVFILIVNPL
jgi:hypothetical protein